MVCEGQAGLHNSAATFPTRQQARRLQRHSRLEIFPGHGTPVHFEAFRFELLVNADRILEETSESVSANLTRIVIRLDFARLPASGMNLG